MICLGGRFRPQDDSIFEKWQFRRGKHLPGPRNCPPVACQVVLPRAQTCDRFASSSRNERVRRPVSRVLSTPRGDGWPFLWDARCRAPRATDPGGGAETPRAGCPACRPYLVLLPVGFAVPLPLPVARWALTPPFHPCLAGLPLENGPARRSVFCGTFPGVAPAGR